MSDNIKQHTLPRFYIAGFGDSAEKASKNPHVWYYPLAGEPSHTWLRKRAKKVSVVPDYYTFPHASPDRKYELERMFKVFEDAASSPILKLARGEEPTSDDLMHLSMFIASLLARPQGLVDGYGEFRLGRARDWVGRLYRHLKEHPEDCPKVVARFKANGVPIKDDNDPEAFNPDRFKLRPIPAAFSAEMLRETVDLLPTILAEGSWTVLGTTEDAPFIASDCPVAISLPAMLGGKPYDGIELTMPLNKTTAIVVNQHVGPTRGYAEVGRFRPPVEGIADINVRTRARASTFLIASAVDFPGAEVVTDPAFKPPPGAGESD